MFLTTPFVPGGHDYMALYTWDELGNFVDAEVDDLGPRSSSSEAELERLFRAKAQQLEQCKRAAIKVAPFEIQKHGQRFGLIPRAPDDIVRHWTVEAQPGNYLSFSPPWNGLYET